MRNFKRALALVLAAILVVGTFATVSAARTSEEKWYQVGIDYLQDIGVDYISPSQAEMKITREQFVYWMAKIESHQLLDEAWDDEIWLGSEMKFADVKPGENKFAAIAYAHQSGFIIGEDDDGDGEYTFAPDRTIILGEVAAILVRMMGYEERVSYENVEGADNWAYNYMRAAQTYCNAFDAIFLEETKHYDPYAELTYGEAAYIVATIMNQTGAPTTSRTADGIKLDDYFTPAVVETVGLREDRYFVISIADEVVLQSVNGEDTITLPVAEFEALVRDALDMADDEAVNVADVLAIGSLVNVIKHKRTGNIVRITFESTDQFTTILNTYLLKKTDDGLRLDDIVPDFFWKDVVVENGEVKSAILSFAGVEYTITNDENSDIYFYSKNMTGEKLTVAEAIANLKTAAEGCVYAVFSAAAENVTYREEINEYGQVINVIDVVKYDTVVIKDSADFVSDFNNDGEEFSFVVKTPDGEIVNTFAPSAIQTGIIEKVTVYAEEGYFLVNIRLSDGTLVENIKLPATKSDRVIEYTYSYKGAEKTYSYNIANNFPMLDEAEEAIKAGIVSGTINLVDATAMWLNDRCVKFAVGEGNEAVYLASAFEEVENTGFVTDSELVETNTYNVAITVVDENGVYDVIYETVRARASSMFDLANYKVYARIWSDSLLNPAAAANDTRVEGETDLIYVDVCRDAMSKYLLCSTGASLNDDWTDIYGGHKLGEIVYKTEFVDADGDGLEEKKVISVASAIGYEPYYARTLVEGEYTYTLKYTRVVFVNDYQLVSYGLQIALELMRFQFTFGGQIENGGDLVLGDEGFLMYDSIKDEDKENYTQEKGWYVFDKEVSFKKGNNTIVVPEGAVLKLEDNAEVVYKTEDNGEYDYEHDNDYTEIEVKEQITLKDVVFTAEGLAKAWNAESVFGVNDVAAENITLEGLDATIVFGEEGIYIDVEADEVIAYRVAEGAEVVFVVPSEDGFDCIINNYSDLVGSGVFGVEWNAKVVDNEITAIAIITNGEVLEAEIPEGVEIPEATLPPEPPVDPEPPVGPVDPPVGPTYTVVDSVEGVELAEGCKIVYFNNFANLTAETIHNGIDYKLVIRIEGAVSIEGELQDAIICYELDMNSGDETFGLDMNLEQVAGMVKGNFYVVNAENKIVDVVDVVTAGKLMTKTAEIVTIEGETRLLAKMTENENEYVDLDSLNVTFVTVNAKGNLEVVADATFEGMTSFDYIAIGATVYVIK